MTYRIVVAPDANDDLRTAYRFIRKSSPEAARAWLTGARQKIKTLAQNPERAPLAPESASFQQPIREIFYGRGNRGTYRILFTILQRTVYIVHVRHGSIRTLALEE